MKISATTRQKQGTGASRRLRNAGRTPGIVYGGNSEPVVIDLDHNNLWHAVQKEIFHSSILELDIDGKKEKVLCRSVQYHPWRQLILHIDFLRILADQEISVTVPLHFINEENSDAVKLASNLVNYVVTEIEVICLPGDLPEYITVDLAGLQSEDVVHASSINLPAGVSFASWINDETVLVTTSKPKVEAEEESTEETAEVAAPAEEEQQ